MKSIRILIACALASVASTALVRAEAKSEEKKAEKACCVEKKSCCAEKKACCEKSDKKAEKKDEKKS